MCVHIPNGQKRFTQIRTLVEGRQVLVDFRPRRRILSMLSSKTTLFVPATFCCPTLLAPICRVLSFNFSCFSIHSSSLIDWNKSCHSISNKSGSHFFFWDLRRLQEECFVLVSLGRKSSLLHIQRFPFSMYNFFVENLATHFFVHFLSFVNSHMVSTALALST